MCRTLGELQKRDVKAFQRKFTTRHDDEDKDNITDEEWTHHFRKVIGRESGIMEDGGRVGVNAENCKQVPELDKEITLNEVNNAISKMKTGRAPGKDGIPTESFKEQF